MGQVQGNGEVMTERNNYAHTEDVDRFISPIVDISEVPLSTQLYIVCFITIICIIHDIPVAYSLRLRSKL